MVQQIAAMHTPIDEARDKWLSITGDVGAFFLYFLKMQVVFHLWGEYLIIRLRV